MARVTLENVKKIYQGGVVAVHDFNLDIADKEFVVFVGPSGCGKSTTLRMVAGLEEISEGTCKIDGEVVNDLQPKDRHISMVFQNYALYPHLTVYENMAFPLRLDKKTHYTPWDDAGIAKINAEIASLESQAAANKAKADELEQSKNSEAVLKAIEKETGDFKLEIHKLKTSLEKYEALKAQFLKEREDEVFKAKVAKEVEGYDKKISELEASKGKDDKKNKLIEEKIGALREKRANPSSARANTKALADVEENIYVLTRKIEIAKKKVSNPKTIQNIDAQIEANIHTKRIAELKESLILGKPHKGYTNDEIYERVTNAAQVLGITQYLTRKPKAMSGGQRQRVAIGRAMVKDCKVFLMDEPLSNLDAKLRNQMRAEIILLRKRINTTFIYVTHDQTEAMTLGDRIVVMRDGFIMQVGTPEQVFDMPDNLFVAQFIGAPMMNTFNAKISSTAGKYSVNFLGANIPVDGDKGEDLKAKKVPNCDVILGVRPEHIGVSLTKQPNTIPATIEVNEMMGSEYHLHVVTEDESKIVVRIPTISLTEKERAAMVAGTKINLIFQSKALHFFNKENEVNLLAKGNPVNSKGPIILPGEAK